MFYIIELLSFLAGVTCVYILVLLTSGTWNRLGIRKEDLPKIEEELEMEIAKSELSELKKECVEAMEGQLKRYAYLTNTLLFLRLYVKSFK
jgi:hypothetical protein